MINKDMQCLKIDTKYFNAVINGIKTFEFRYNDRNYCVGDIYYLCEYSNNQFSGSAIKIQITYILKNYIGLEKNYCIFSFKIMGRL